MPAIMADNDVGGAFDLLVQCLQSETWQELWASLGFSVQTFETLGLARNATDQALWQACQKHQVALVTGNRNGPTSLESTIRDQNTAVSLPVFTLANAERVLIESILRRTGCRTFPRLLDGPRQASRRRPHLASVRISRLPVFPRSRWHAIIPDDRQPHAFLVKLPFDEAD